MWLTSGRSLVRGLGLRCHLASGLVLVYSLEMACFLPLWHAVFERGHRSMALECRRLLQVSAGQRADLC